MSLVGHHSPTSMLIYTHARNVRYRDQLEALEPKRCGNRTKSFSKAVELPEEVTQRYLEERRQRAAKRRDKDSGNELLLLTRCY